MIDRSTVIKKERGEVEIVVNGIVSAIKQNGKTIDMLIGDWSMAAEELRNEGFKVKITKKGGAK